MVTIGPWKNFRANPSSLKWATIASVSVTVGLVTIGALLMWAFDRDEYPNYGEALWFTLQTITTVGYGDGPPVSAVGRVVASVVMLVSIGLITVITAVITSIFIESARRSRAQEHADDTTESLARIEAALTDAQARLDRIERAAVSGAADD